jgi:hypothetical protein
MAYKPNRRSSLFARHSGTPLPDIPEVPQAPISAMPHRTVTPGPNAFAQQAAELEQHRYETNAFYQQTMARRRVTPPTDTHPALREGYVNTSPVTHLDVAGMRDSGLTTMSPFLGPLEQTPPTPPVLLPRSGDKSYPTERGFIEDKREQLQHQNSGSENERTAVFIPTPKIDSSEFSRSASYATPQKKKVGIIDWATSTEQTRTPKKSLLEKLRFTTPRSSQVNTSTSSLSTNRGDGVYGGGEILPPKAKAVLSTSPHKANLGRTSSKRKGLFSRKPSDRPSLETHKTSPAYLPNVPRSAGAHTLSFSDATGKTPQTAHTTWSDPTYDRHDHSKRALSQTHSDQGKDNKTQKNSASGITRSKSLQYYDRAIPPTPPAKNTPPHEKERRAQEEKARFILEDQRRASEKRCREARRNLTPKQEMLQTPLSKLQSALHNGIFADDTPTQDAAEIIDADGRTSPRKDPPKLVKQPSVYSMHASYYPNLNDQYSFEEMKNVTDGLGLEGLSDLPESFYKSEPNITYSPSLYADEPGNRSSVVQRSPNTLHQLSTFKHSPSLAAVSENHRLMPSKGTLSEKPSVSSQGTLDFVYPDLASDPSRSDLKEALHTHHRSTSEIQLPVHSRKQSPSHSRSPRKSPQKELTEALGEEDVPLSPPNYNCPSAMPSPLQVLPSSSYTPARKLKVEVDIEPASPTPSSAKTLTPSRSRGRIETFKSATSPIARVSASSFDDLPTLSPSIKPKFGALPSTAESDEQTEPQKQDHASSTTNNNTTDAAQVQQEESQQDAPSPDSKPSLMQQIREQQAQIASLKAELLEITTHTTPLSQSANLLLQPPTPGLSSCADSDIGHASSVADISDYGEQSEVVGSYVEEGNLAQLGLYHRMRQQRVDQGYSPVHLADIERHEHSDNTRKPKKDGLSDDFICKGEVMGMFEELAKEIRDLKAASKEGK